MLISIFGLTISSSWGNGHATLWRALAKSIVKKNNKIVFFEHDMQYYLNNRDYHGDESIEIVFYSSWESIQEKAIAIANISDVAIVTSYCPDGRDASNLVTQSSAKIKLYYDMDTPITINSIIQGLIPFYFPENGLGGFDAALSYTGGKVLEIQKTLLCAKKTFPLYGSVDPTVHYSVKKCTRSTGLLSYLGTYSSDRHSSFEKLFLDPARQLSLSIFLLGGAQYPSNINWSENIVRIEHVAPEEHSFFYSSCLFTLNITRSIMAEFGYCPSGRLFEAAACGVPIISDYWEGLDSFFETSKEILIAESTDVLIRNLAIHEERRECISKSAKERVLSDHTSDNRANDFLTILSQI